MFYDGLECVVCSFEIYLLGAVNIFLMGKEIYYYFDRQAARNFIEPKKKKKHQESNPRSTWSKPGETSGANQKERKGRDKIQTTPQGR